MKCVTRLSLIKQKKKKKNKKKKNKKKKQQSVQSMACFVCDCFLRFYHFTSTNRKEGNGQESIQLPNTFRPKHQKERSTHLKPRQHNQNTTSRKLKGQFLSQNWPNGYQNENFTRTYIQRHTTTAQQKHCLGTARKNFTRRAGMRGLNQIYVTTTLALSSAVVYTRHFLSPLEGFLTQSVQHLLEHIYIYIYIYKKRIQKCNNDKDSTARNN